MTPATGPNPPAPPALSVSSTSSAPPRRGRALPVMFAIAVVVLAADTISTALALDKLAGHPTVRMLNGLITVHTTLNAGAAFGFGTSYTAVICLFGCGVVLAIIILAKRLRSRAWTIALGLLLGGAAANLAPAPVMAELIEVVPYQQRTAAIAETNAPPSVQTLAAQTALQVRGFGH